MTTLIFLVGMIALICLPVFGAIFIFRREQDIQAIDFKQRREEEEYFQWLENMGLKETSFFFSAYGIRLLSIWGIRMTAGGIFK